ncbi:putative ribonuclease H-like domain, reverse transcriptase zinc-binding domain-containing protein [Senna tora]|uniref:Putative ribonuclease H-like domain, reverse transcriptase zinc-binding domain-containing protein n=1 Tax=Senna tora TaxID=362788 RepID=A0A834W196_9FABA|nr:putative ribonuclease H-like domain, reverse transcriptase zinc-binding domain-containing protein [Senna tora]
MPFFPLILRVERTLGLGGQARMEHSVLNLHIMPYAPIRIIHEGRSGTRYGSAKSWKGSNQDLPEWIEQNLTKCLGNWEEHKWGDIFAISCWLLWKQRNNIVFKNSVEKPISLITGIQNQLVYVKEAMALNVKQSRFQTRRQMTVSKGGGHLTQIWSRWIVGFAKNLGKGNALLAELWGIRLGLQIATDNSLSNITLESDSLATINMIKGNTSSSHPLFPMVVVIRRMLESYEGVRLVHVSSNANRVADAMAKQGHLLPFGDFLYEEPPVFCSIAYQEDCIS